jgi:protein-S-isoprenylcysteine O-methyltransferase Ste14
VRFVDPETVRTPRRLVASPEDLRVVRRHHRVFYALLAAAPLEWWLRGRPAGWSQLLGGALLFAGVVGYRRAGGALGDHLSPLVAPCEPAALVDRGPYRRLRHPMYRAEIAIAFGAPWLLGAPLTVALSVLFTVLVIRRIDIEERLLGARLDDYAGYASRTYRLVPYVY